ncbi:ABC transporter substrate-binding protein [Plantibacter sp. CFBP 13570]|uniref:ABC transporter substrate-binding protein n=1 Tax=Plantibacter sp. CFBP 13570 TaxID=2775272 RepID=UPI001930C584|nr:ABC transporter substrate-binding protein [Plantibacter sp. CFBP 13570]MBD8535950.1 ABC transporter substrate-binding protein [Plantibacter sp. CFBP 13570]
MTRTTRRRARLAAAALVAVSIALTGCSAASASSDADGGSLTYLDAEIPTSAQVQEAGTWQTRALQQNITDRLLYRNAETGELEPWIADSWTVSPDGLTYTFVIRDGVTYSDGTAVDATSVAKNLNWQSTGDEAKGTTPNAQFPPGLVATPDDATSTVTVVLAAPYAPFLDVLTGWGSGLVADATIDASKEEQSQFVNLIGSGPFVVASETYGKEIVLDRREGYAWAPPSSPNQGEAHLASVTVIPVQEDSVRLGTLKSGEADVIRYVQPSEEQGLVDAGYDIVSKTGVGLSNQWFLRSQAPFLDDVDVRKALLHAIDREQIIETQYTDSWTPATSVLSPGTFGYVDESAKFAYDPDAANNLLDGAGWTEHDADGYRTKGGERLTVKTYIDVYDNTAKSLFQQIQNQFKDVGIELSLNELDYSTYWATAFADPEVGALRVGWPHPDPSKGLSEYYSKDGSDLLGLAGSDTTLQSLLDAQNEATDDDTRAVILGQIQDHLIDQAYVVPILNDSQVFVTQQRVKGFSLTDGALPEFYNTSIED